MQECRRVAAAESDKDIRVFAQQGRAKEMRSGSASRRLPAIFR